ncbi:MAG: hypothetical protein E2O87_01925 [Bacteroidetes bacterium]|nr:MAG: hypothetical protein E2O87_01925 [Bacteroidota bacterium]
MKRFKYIIMTIILAVGSTAVFTSCEDSDKFRFPELGNGGFVKFTFLPDCWEGLFAISGEGFSITKYHIGTDPTEASFNAVTEDPSGNVASYELFVRGTFKGAPKDPIAYMSTTTFPFDVSYTAQDLATLFSVPVETIQSEDDFFFTSTIITHDGRVYNSNASSCEDCPDEVFFDENGNPVDENGDPLDPGNWNGGTNDSVLLQGGDTGENELIPAIFWVVRYLSQTCI